VLLPVRFVGPFLTARFGDARNGSPRAQPKSLTAVHFRFFRQTLIVSAVNKALTFSLTGLTLVLFLCLGTVGARAFPGYRPELNVVYDTVAGKELVLNAFLPTNSPGPAPAMVDIHGGWFYAGGAAQQMEGVGGWQLFGRRGIAVFSIEYRLGAQGGFPQNIEDCRNAIRFIRKNAARFNIDPQRIDVTGGSAGGHLSLMVAMAPEDFPDGGPAAALQGVSAKVSGSFSYIPPTDFVRFWNQGPEDVITNADGTVSFRPPDDRIPDDGRPRLRVLFHGVTPDTTEHRMLYTNMCPIGHVRADVPPLLICDGEKDPIVPGLHGKVLYEKLRAAGADATYWMTVNGGHEFPHGEGFDKVLDDFLVHSLNLDVSGHP
jgi:acetyl esterase/lipase